MRGAQAAPVLREFLVEAQNRVAIQIKGLVSNTCLAEERPDPDVSSNTFYRSREVDAIIEGI
jgi:hypothetical protein